ncbi:MAG: DUF6034 family protein [Clostridium sp.]|nr:DUF6034 family protein [Clostridium sp.]MCM1399789.1 DUF6034 family protein [Clostridium sp.]MCM1459584.1 DUF6034 family protein [Bacteroides sp.]
MKIKKSTAVMLCVILIMLSGCTKREKVDMSGITSEEVESTSEEAENKKDYDISTAKGGLRESLDIPEVWQEDLATSGGSGSTVRIYAEVIVPDVTGVNVMETKPKEVNQGFWDEYINGMEFDEVYSIESEEAKGNFTEKELEMLSYKGDGYVAIRNGVRYVISAYKEVNSELIECVPFSYGDFIKDREVKELSLGWQGYMAGYDVDNRCHISEDTLEETFYDELGQLGISDMRIEEINILRWYITEKDDRETNYYDGYSVLFAKNIDGIDVADRYAYFNNIFEFSGEEGMPEVGYIDEYSQEYVRFYINDEGIISMEYNAPRYISEIKAENVKLLDFEQVKEIYREIITNSKADRENIILLRKLELKYFAIPNEEDTNVQNIVPVWILSDGDTQSERFIIINAIDGSVIQLL